MFAVEAVRDPKTGRFTILVDHVEVANVPTSNLEPVLDAVRATCKRIAAEIEAVRNAVEKPS